MPDPLLPGDPTRTGPYTLHARLGGGGMGQVFLGRSPGGRTVAVKVVRPDLAQDAEFRRRFATEVAAARKVGGFYTAQVVDTDTSATPPWLATAYIPGPTLHRAVADHGPLPVETVAVLGAGLAEGLSAVHAQGVVHRDLKPGNVLLAEDGPRLIDFGIARALDSTSHTRTSTVLGTAAFMSPEQAKTQKVGPASDVFSLGCVLAFAATGRSPFGDGPVHAVVFRVVHEEPDLADLPASLVDLVRACLAKDPESRPGAEEVSAHLAAVGVSRASDTGRWLPPDVTETLARYTLAYTRFEPGQDRDPEGGPAGPAKQMPQATGSDTIKPETPTFWRRLRGVRGVGAGAGEQRDSPKGAGGELVIGNLSPHPVEVAVDGTVLGTAPGFASRAFPVPPGQRSLLVSSEGRGVARRVKVSGGDTAKLAFDVLPGPHPAPEPVEQVVITGGRLSGVGGPALMFGGIVWIASGLLAVTMYATGEAHPSVSGTEMLVAVVVGGLIAGLLGGLLAFFSGPPRLVLSRAGLRPPHLPASEKPFRWDRLEQVSVVGEGEGAQVVVWPRRGWPLETTRTLKDYQGGKVVCRAEEVNAVDPLQAERLRAALRWFAADIWVEQPAAP
ncbi:protein kinase domain-containing protein [Nocardiopsis changdeensis]|uniref:Serine/threonine protein kinase n=1 Tax=Nocardiopsis changdeensis TaxID=2831969 RepID=A0ABX8BET7_9ACTN|nr:MULTISPECIES: serine/threonine-protein kinase [Nocardiopsis]QUX20547.1 serine/threonine protein kinase [Nocardiopsis changdeensis]QYX36478.1 serine/threonine protein kinase [Nocardiopsis sp. MT53]